MKNRKFRRLADQAVATQMIATAHAHFPPKQLVFDVLGQLYRVRIVPAPLKFEGVNALGICDEHGEIRIADKAPPGDRLGTLFHELGHAYLFAHEYRMGRRPNLDNDEGLCAMMEDVGMIVTRQLTAQGGEAALMAMESAPRKVRVR